MLRPCFCLAVVLIAAYGLHVPGVSGDFLFDDHPNLSVMGDLGGVTDWDTFRAFVLSGWSGPTGRPLALASFLIDDNTWPSHAPWFKHTNVLIHLLCGLLLCWAVLLLLRNLGTVSERQAQWVAVLACALWVLHPYMVSTTLYVVQRMAQLATLFALAGIVGYLYGRLNLEKRPFRSYFVMSFAVGAGTLLAVFSKENGALLPLLVLVIEFFLPARGKPAWQWRGVCLWLPSLCVIGLLLRYVDFSENPWPERNFNQPERLLTEARILCEYLLHLFVPRIEGNGLYQDGYVVSRSLFEPVSTLVAIVVLAGLALVALRLRTKAPLVGLAILLFLSAHLVESTVIGLELYFEHRNHLAALFLFLPIAYYVVTLGERYKLLPWGVALVIVLMASMTWLRASLWGNGTKLEMFWVQSATESPRAVNAIAAYYMSQGHHEEATRYLERESKRLRHSSLLTVRLLLQKVYAKEATRADFLGAAEKLKVQQFDAQTVMGLRTIVQRVIEGRSTVYAVYMLSLLDELQENEVYNSSTLYRRLADYLRAQLYLHIGDVPAAYKYYSSAMALYQEADAAFAMVAEMASAGHFNEAVKLLDQASAIMSQQDPRTLKRSRVSYEQDRLNLRKALGESMNDQNAAPENL